VLNMDRSSASSSSLPARPAAADLDIPHCVATADEAMVIIRDARAARTL
jgi:hypothetical protein